MQLALSNNGFGPDDFERFRLALSVFQDGTGWESRKLKNDMRVTYAGYRQFERIIAELVDGSAREDKGIFDVLGQLPNSQGTYYGISCKMKNGLKDASKPNGFTYIEMSNASGKFLDTVEELVGSSFLARPNDAGQAILYVVQQWYDKAEQRYKCKIDLDESSHLVLLYDDTLSFRLFQHRLNLPRAEDLNWAFREPRGNKKSRCLVGTKPDRKVFEWYLSSGGQLKYYPPVSEAVWVSDEFRMEPLPDNTAVGILARADAYFGKGYPVKF